MRFISTKVVIDIATGAVLEREGYWYEGDVALCESGKTGQQKVAENLVGSNTTDENNALQNQQNFAGAQTRSLEAAQGTNAQFEGPVQNSPFYKALLRTGISSTSNAYQNAKTNMRQQAQKAGFGYEQPVTQGAENQIDAAEASDLGALPDKALEASAPLSLEASGQTGNLAGQEGNTAAQYGNQALGFGNQVLGANQQAANLQARRQQAQQSLWNSIAQITPSLSPSNLVNFLPSFGV